MGPDVFGAVPEHDLRRAGRRRRFDRGEVVFHRDDPGDSLHRVESGRFAARIITPLGDSATVSLHGPGDVFGLLAVIGPTQRRTATVVALEAAETLAIPRSAFLQLRAAHPEMRDAIEEILAVQLAATTDRLVEALYTPVASRVRAHLIELAALYGDLEAAEVTIPLSQEHLAGLSGHDPRDGEPGAQAGAGARRRQALARSHRRAARPAARASALGDDIVPVAAPAGTRRTADDEGPAVADPSPSRGPARWPDRERL